MKSFLLLLLMTIMTGMMAQKTIHDFTVEALDGSTIDFSDYAGKKILIVNTASKCGFTPQYADLEKLSQEYPDNLVVVGFPANNFMKQEPGTNEEIAEFCQKNYGVSFPMAAKIDVKGKNIAPIYEWLTTKELNGKSDYKISWNFNKFLIDEDGNIIDHYGSKVSPLAEDITKQLN